MCVRTQSLATRLRQLVDVALAREQWDTAKHLREQAAS